MNYKAGDHITKDGKLKNSKEKLIKLAENEQSILSQELGIKIFLGEMLKIMIKNKKEDLTYLEINKISEDVIKKLTKPKTIN